MSTLNVSIAHNHNIEVSKKKISEYIDKKSKENPEIAKDIVMKWEGDKLIFNGSSNGINISGVGNLFDKKIDLVTEIPIAVKIAFGNKITQIITDEMNKILK